MCGMCADNPGEKDMERKRLRALAIRLRQVAAMCEGIADGSIRSHTDDAKKRGPLVRSVIRELVAEWV